MKKVYYYKIVEKKPQRNGGYSVSVQVFTVKGGKISKVGNLKWNTSAFKGENSAVYEFLYDNKLVTAKEYKDNKGYYYSSKSKVSIESL
jgi:hypothetical protein